MFVQDRLLLNRRLENNSGAILAQSQNGKLNVSSLFGMPAEIPARSMTRVRKQRVDARLRLRRVEQILRLTILLPHRVVRLHPNEPNGCRFEAMRQRKITQSIP